jgi:hypothetical protein
VTVTLDQRDKLLAELGIGQDLEAAAAVAGVALEVIRRDHELLAKCAAAYRLGTARLRSKVLEAALRGGDVHVLERAIARREAAEREVFRPPAQKVEDGGGIDWRQLDDTELRIVEALLRFDVAAARQILHEYAIGLAQPIAREMARASLQYELGADARVIDPDRPDEMPVLDEGVPIQPERALSPIPVRSRPAVSSSPLIR